MHTRWILAAVLLTMGTGLAVALAGGGGNFDHLADTDRKVFQERFTKEIWPLLQRNGKDGCVGCHSSGKGVTSLRMKGDPTKDFPMLVKEGFFIPDDEGSLLNRITTKSVARRMPLKKDPWANEDVEVLRKFVVDMDKKQQKPKAK